MNEPLTATACISEIEELHALFTRWFRGIAVDGEFDRFTSVMAEGFVMITPGGAELSREDVISMVRERRHAFPDRPFDIRIRNPRITPLAEGFALGLYEEWQETEAGLRGRLSSVVFREKSGTPQGVEWIHLHETWLPE